MKLSSIPLGFVPPQVSPLYAVPQLFNNTNLLAEIQRADLSGDRDSGQIAF